MTKFIFFIVCLTVLFTGCKKDGRIVDPVVPTGYAKLEFNNMFDTLDLALDSVNFILDDGSKLKVFKYKYYISNIKLTATDGTVYTEEESYYLINESSPSSQIITLKKVPFKEFTSITFMIGVDSTRNVSGLQTGALAVNNDMFWTWNSGYIMAKLEGVSQQSTAIGGSVGFHIGGFSGVNSALKTVTLSFNGSSAVVKDGVIPNIHIKCDVKQWFINPVTLDLANVNNVTTVNPTSKMIADNYADMFSVTDVHN